MGAAIIYTKNGQIVRRVSVSADTLDKVAELLGIPKEERDTFISDTDAIHVHRGDKPTSGTS
ncbi:MAG TPA: hypothetical protein VMU81_28400 [Acetobacteraceae bacterium]|nr:hypothetical protein [Acetobacteraceae bacterium]